MPPITNLAGLDLSFQALVIDDLQRIASWRLTNVTTERILP